jgi:hypothetical protein
LAVAPVNDWQCTMGKRRYLVATVTAIAWGFATSAGAEVHIEGDLSALRVTTSRDTLSEVFSAFDSLFHVKYRTAVPLNEEINGAYSGSLSQVVARLLDGYNYVMKNDHELTEIIIFGKSGEAAVSPKVPLVKGVLSRWR